MDTIDDGMLSEQQMPYGETTHKNMHTLSIWAFFLSFVGLISSLCSVGMGLIFILMMNTAIPDAARSEAGGIFIAIGISFCFFGLGLLLPSAYLFAAAWQALFKSNRSPEDMEIIISRLKHAFMFFGILIIVSFLIYLCSFLVAAAFAS